MFRVVLDDYRDLRTLSTPDKLKWNISSCFSIMKMGDSKGYSYYRGRKDLRFYGTLSFGVFNRMMTYTLWCDNVELL